MPSAKVYRFPRSPRSWHRPAPPARYVDRRSRRAGPGFGRLLFVTLVMAFLYLSGAAGVARHDSLYALLLTAIWAFFFASAALLRQPVIGPMLAGAGQLMLAVLLASAFGFLYWLVLTHP